MCYVSSGIKQDLEKLLLGKSKLQTNNTAVKVINATLRLNEYKIRCALTNIQNSLASIYRGSPTITISTSTSSTSTIFSAIGIKFVLVEFDISKFVLVEFSLCTTQLVRISHSTIFARSQKSY